MVLCQPREQGVSEEVRVCGMLIGDQLWSIFFFSVSRVHTPGCKDEVESGTGGICRVIGLSGSEFRVWGNSGLEKRQGNRDVRCGWKQTQEL